MFCQLNWALKSELSFPIAPEVWVSRLRQTLCKSAREHLNAQDYEKPQGNRGKLDGCSFSLQERDLLSMERKLLLTNEVLSSVLGFGITGH